MTGDFGEQFGERKPVLRREPVVFECDLGVLSRIDEWAERYGLTRDEAIRYIIGQFLPDFGLPSVSQAVPLSMQGRFRPTTIPSDDEMTDAGKKIYKTLANIISAQGSANCPECMQRLSSDDLINGKCSNCGKEF